MTKWKPHRDHQDSLCPWLGQIPKHWRTLRLKTTLARNEGGVWGDDPDNGGTIVLRSTDQTVDGDWRIVEPAKRNLSHTEYLAGRLKRNDLVITKSSGSALHIGKTSIVTQEVEALDCCFSSFMQRLRANKENCPRFLYYLLNSSVGREQLVFGSNTTTGLANLNGTVIGNVLVASPPLAEQRAIADFLDRETAQIDELIAKKQRLIELLQEKRTALISHAVTKGLDPNVPMKDSAVEWIDEIPTHWEAIRLKRIASIKYGLGEPPSEKEDGLALLRATNIERGKIVAEGLVYIDPEEVPYDRDPVLQQNDIIVVHSGAYTGDSAMVTAEWAGAIAGYDMVVRTTKQNPTFIAYSLLSKGVLNDQIDLCRLRAAQPHLNAEELGHCVFCLPSIGEQAEIAAALDEKMKQLDMLISKTEQAIEKLQEYRTALISAAVTGKIDVRKEAQ